MADSNSKSRKPSLTGDYLINFLTTAYVFVMLCIYPLFYRNRYFDMGESKFLFFKWFSGVMFVVLAVVWLYRFIDYHFSRDAYEVSFEKAFKGMNKTDIFAIAYFFLTWISFLLSSAMLAPGSTIKLALWGFPGWNMGFISQLFFIFIYFFVSRFWKKNDITIIAMLVIATFTFQMTIVQRFGFNPLGMYNDVRREDLEKFVSTLGQTSWFSSYAVLMVPVGMYFYIFDKRMQAKILSILFTALSFGMLVTTHSDSAYIAFTFILLTYFCFCLESNEKMFRFLEVVIVGLLSMRIVGWMNLAFPDRVQQTIVEPEKLTKAATQSTPMLILLIAAIVIYTVFRFVICGDKPWERAAELKKEEERKAAAKTVKKTVSKKNQKNNKNKGRKNQAESPAPVVEEKPAEPANEGFDISRYARPIRVTVLSLLVISIIAIVMCVVLVTNGTIPADTLLGRIDYFHYADSWGNHRGFNWRMAIKAFKNSSVKDLLVGVGPDCFADAMDKYCQPEVYNYWSGLTLACAHNEFLNLLITGGFLGLFAYLGIMVACFVELCRGAKDEPFLIPFAAAIPAYFGHNFFCYQQCICTPVLFLLMAMGMRMLRMGKAKE